ncbi:MAG: hypothetical protein D6730_09070 [Bacteroidetes bacterium]|nr:MAG: hypothetical protein D6730_09070 [Bacteroidota bacterium]
MKPDQFIGSQKMGQRGDRMQDAGSRMQVPGDRIPCILSLASCISLKESALRYDLNLATCILII